MCGEVIGFARNRISVSGSLLAAIQQLGRLAKDHGVSLRQSYVRVAKQAAVKAGRYAHGLSSSSA